MGAQNRAVTRALRRRVRPILEAVGFEDFTERKAWRRSGDLVEVVDVRAIGGLLSSGVGCTACSFVVDAGVRYADCDTWDGGPAQYLARPEPHQCTFELNVGKRLRQPGAFRPYGGAPRLDRADVWAVDEDLGNLEEVVDDAASTLAATALPLLTEFGTPELAYAALVTRDSTDPVFGEPGIGLPGAPGAARWIGVVRCLADRLGRDPEPDIAAARSRERAP